MDARNCAHTRTAAVHATVMDALVRTETQLLCTSPTWARPALCMGQLLFRLGPYDGFASTRLAQ